MSGTLDVAREPAVAEAADANRQTFAGLLRVIAGRRSARHFLHIPVERDLVDSALVAACRAPSAHDARPWRWVNVATRGTRHDLAVAMAGMLESALVRNGVSAAEARRAALSKEHLLDTAPALIVACLDSDALHPAPDQVGCEIEWQMAVQGIGFAGQNLLLALHAANLAACWLADPLFAPDVVTRVLNLPPTWKPQGFVVAGYPASRSAEREPVDLASFVILR